MISTFSLSWATDVVVKQMASAKERTMGTIRFMSVSSMLKGSETVCTYVTRTVRHTHSSESDPPLTAWPLPTACPKFDYAVSDTGNNDPPEILPQNRYFSRASTHCVIHIYKANFDSKSFS